MLKKRTLKSAGSRHVRILAPKCQVTLKKKVGWHATTKISGTAVNTNLNTQLNKRFQSRCVFKAVFKCLSCKLNMDLNKGLKHNSESPYWLPTAKSKNLVCRAPRTSLNFYLNALFDHIATMQLTWVKFFLRWVFSLRVLISRHRRFEFQAAASPASDDH